MSLVTGEGSVQYKWSVSGINWDNLRFKYTTIHGPPIKLSIAQYWLSRENLKSKKLHTSRIVELSSWWADVKIVLSIISVLSYEWICSIWASNMDVKHNIYVIIEHNMRQNCPAGWRKCVLLLRLFCRKNIFISPLIITVVGHCVKECYYFELQSPILLLKSWVGKWTIIVKMKNEPPLW